MSGRLYRLMRALSTGGVSLLSEPEDRGGEAENAVVLHLTVEEFKVVRRVLKKCDRWREVLTTEEEA